MLRGMDISANNPNPDLAAEQRDHGLELVRIKIAEGTYYVSPDARAQWDEAGQLNLLRGLYYFATPSLNDPTAGANFCLGAISGQGIVFGAGDTLHLDYEEAGNVGAANPSEWALSWLDEVGRAIGAAPAFPGVYCDLYRATQVLTDPRLGAYTWWAAAWTQDASVPNDEWPTESQAPSLAGTPFLDMDLWQFSASSFTTFPTAVIPGRGVDLDVSFLTVEQYAKYGMRAPSPPQQFKQVTDQWLRAQPDAKSDRLINVPVGAIVTNYGAPTPHWLWVTYQGVHGWDLRSNVVPVDQPPA
jgi:GH25 family lysozyme M1 (1,4-beta-N-acetylmuramidase)